MGQLISLIRYNAIMIGRFAPSPTGPLHFGSLLTAVGSYLEAKSQQGLWYLRIEDLDPPREVAGSTIAIIQSLTDHGFQWDGDVVYQSQRIHQYEQVLKQLKSQQQVYACDCSRQRIAQHPLNQTKPKNSIPVYPNHCRHRTHVNPPCAWRIKTDLSLMTVYDQLQPDYSQCLLTEVGDFVIKRKDDLFAYHLAVVVDDAAQAVTQVVRGIDLMDATPRHLWLQRCLKYTTPHYLHLPVIVNDNLEKLSKQTLAPAIHVDTAAHNLVRCLKALGQDPPYALSQQPVATIWQWAKQHWQRQNIPQVAYIKYQDIQLL